MLRAEDFIDQLRHPPVIRTTAVQEPGGNLGILLFEQALKRGAPAGIGKRPIALEPPSQQQVEFPHAASATPAQHARDRSVSRHDWPGGA